MDSERHMESGKFEIAMENFDNLWGSRHNWLDSLVLEVRIGTDSILVDLEMFFVFPKASISF